MLACELLAWTRMLALAGKTRCREPKWLRLRLFRRRPPGRLRPPPVVPPRRTLALGQGDDRHSRPPAGPPVRLNSRNNATIQRYNTGARGTPPARRYSRAARHLQDLKSVASPASQVTTSQARKD